LQNHSHCLQS